MSHTTATRGAAKPCTWHERAAGGAVARAVHGACRGGRWNADVAPSDAVRAQASHPGPPSHALMAQAMSRTSTTYQTQPLQTSPGDRGACPGQGLKLGGRQLRACDDASAPLHAVPRRPHTAGAMHCLGRTQPAAPPRNHSDRRQGIQVPRPGTCCGTTCPPLCCCSAGGGKWLSYSTDTPCPPLCCCSAGGGKWLSYSTDFYKAVNCAVHGCASSERTMAGPDWGGVTINPQMLDKWISMNKASPWPARQC
jgi:hypothetical protein